jgi:hypothetical protein
MAERYALALGTGMAHVAGSLVMTVAGIRSVQFLLRFL